ncbi:MAG: hypothetical protein ACOYLI_02235 [Synechococcus lacustris]|jgi:hypothetical protein
MQAEWSVAQEPMPHWLENLEDQASATRLELEQEQSQARLAELESLLEELPGIFERKFQQRLEPVLDRQQLLIDENERLRALVERLLPQPGEVRLRFPDRRPPQQALGGADQAPLPPLLRLIRGGRPDGEPLPRGGWEDPTHR